jgi:hypothetical protein
MVRPGQLIAAAQAGCAATPSARLIRAKPASEFRPGSSDLRTEMRLDAVARCHSPLKWLLWPIKAAWNYVLARARPRHWVAARADGRRGAIAAIERFWAGRRPAPLVRRHSH